MNRLNEILAKVAEEADVQFVSVDAAFGDSATGKVPNPADVHPNAEGYRAMANSFLNVYAKGAMQVVKNEIPPANPLTFEKIMQQQRPTKDTDESAILPSSLLGKELLALAELKPLI